MRKKIKVSSIIVVSCVALGMLTFGIGSFLNRTATPFFPLSRPAITIGSHPVSLSEVHTAYVNTIVATKMDSMDPKMYPIYDLALRAAQELATKRQMALGAQSMGFAVPESIVAQEVKTIPFFLDSKGTFDAQKLQSYLKESGLSELEFSQMISDVFYIRQLFSFLNTTSMPEYLQKAVFNYFYRSYDLSYAPIAYNSMKLIPATDKEIQSYYENHESQYRVPETRSADVVVLDPQAYLKSETPSVAEAQKIYIKNPPAWSQIPEKRSFVVYKFKTQSEAEAYHSALMKKSDIDPPQKGSEQKMNEVFKDLIASQIIAEQAFSLKSPDDLGSVAQDGEDWFFVRMQKIDHATILPFEKVQDKFQSFLAAERAEKKVEEIAQKFQQDYEKSKNFQQTAQAHSLSVHKLQDIGRFTHNPPEGTDPILKESALIKEISRSIFLSHTENEFVPPQKVPSGKVYFSFVLTKKTPAHVKKLEEVVNQVKAKLLAEKQEEEALEHAEKILKTFEKNPNENLQTLLPQAERVRSLSLSSYANATQDEVKVPIQLLKELFEGKHKQNFFKFQVDDAVFIVKINSVTEPSKKIMEENFASFTSKLRNNTQQAYITAMQKFFEKAYPIQINKEVVNSLYDQKS